MVLGLTGFAALLLVLALVLGVFNSPYALLRFRLQRDAYQAAAQRVVAEEAPRARAGEFRFYRIEGKERRLVDSPYFFYIKDGGTDFVYFAVNNEVTMSDGLMYSSTGAAPPKSDSIGVLKRLDSQWYQVAFNNAVLEYGKLEP